MHDARTTCSKFSEQTKTAGVLATSRTKGDRYTYSQRHADKGHERLKDRVLSAHASHNTSVCLQNRRGPAPKPRYFNILDGTILLLYHRRLVPS